MNIKPLKNNVLVKLVKKETTTKSGILLVNPVDNKNISEGIVINIGKGSYNNEGILTPIDGIKINDKVLFTNYVGTKVEVEDESYYIVNAKDILAVIE